MMLQDRNKRKFGIEIVDSPSLANTDVSMDDNYHAPPFSSSEGPQLMSAAGLDRSMMNQRSRFVAGEAFFNYDAFGSLREGLDPVRLQSSAYMGLLVNAFAAGFCITLFNQFLSPTLVAFLKSYHAEQSNSAHYLFQWPGAFAVFIGLVSDCFPIAGFRRKSYMLLGWLVALTMFSAIAIVYFTMSVTASIYGYLFVVFGLVAGLGMQVAWIASLAMTVEFAQREHLYQRGHLQSLYMFTYYCAAALTFVLMTVIPMPSVGQMMLMLVGGSIVPMPFVLCCLQEYRGDGSMQEATLRSRTSDLWHFTQHKVVYNMFFFLVGLVSLNGAYHPMATSAVMAWSGVDTPTKRRNIGMVQAFTHVFAILFWKAFLVNFSWRKLAAVGVLFKSTMRALLLLLTIYGVVRSEYFFYVMIALVEITHSWLELFTLVPPTEIADVGREGATIGLINSFMVLITITTKTLWDSLSSGFGLGDVSPQELKVDASSTRNALSLAVSVYIAINLCSILFVGFTPSQKLDAQHLRSFGGYNPTARLVLFVSFLVLFTYSLVANLTKIFQESR